MRRVFPLTIQQGLSQSGSYILMLCEPSSAMQIPIFIGAHEAEAILLAKDAVATRRPMTHMLMANILDAYGVGLKKVTIDKVVEGIFYATLHTTDGFNEKPFDCRTSDAITLALHVDCPIMMAESVIEETGMHMDDPSLSNGSSSPQHDIGRLEAELRACEEREDYERAAEIQLTIEKLRQQQQ